MSLPFEEDESHEAFLARVSRGIVLAHTETIKLNRTALEQQGVFFFDCPPIVSEEFPAQYLSLTRAKQFTRGAGFDTDVESPIGTIPEQACWLREMLLDTAKVVPIFAQEELESVEVDELPKLSIFMDDRYLER